LMHSTQYVLICNNVSPSARKKEIKFLEGERWLDLDLQDCLILA